MSPPQHPQIQIARDLIVIPARFGSTRLPGKPLKLIGGRTMLHRVVAAANAAAIEAGNCDVVVATDDPRIAAHGEELGADVAMTEPALNSGSERAFAAARQRPTPPPNIVNLQADAPFISPEIIVELIAALRTGGADVVTPVFRLDWERLDRLREHKRTAPFSGTTCVRGANGQALWFSKSILPAIRNEANLRCEPLSPVWQHLGLYGYRMAALEWFSSAPPTPYESLEGLEQLRFIENGWTIATIEVDAPDHVVSGIDTPADLAMAEAAIATHGDPFVC